MFRCMVVCAVLSLSKKVYGCKSVPLYLYQIKSYAEVYSSKHSSGLSLSKSPHPGWLCVSVLCTTETKHWPHIALFPRPPPQPLPSTHNYIYYIKSVNMPCLPHPHIQWSHPKTPPFPPPRLSLLCMCVPHLLRGP